MRTSRAYLSLLLIPAACAGPPRRPAIAIGAPPTAVMGGVAVQAIPDPERTRAPLPPDQEILPPTGAPGNRMPEFPPQALKDGVAPATQVVRIVIGVDGAVSRISDSPLRESTLGRFAAEFRASVVDAVRGWRFTPARWRRLADGEDYDGDGAVDYRRVVESREIPVFLDLVFEFRIVDGRPVVGLFGGT